MNRAVGLGLALLVSLALAAPLVGGVGLAQEASTPDGNSSSVQHVDPASAEDDGDRGALESYLSRQLEGRLSDSAIQISQGQYESAKGLVGDEYRDTLGQYVDVAGETGNEETAESFQTSQERQRDFAQSAQNYSETREEYQEAKRNGDEDRARRLARELERHAGNVSQHGRQVQRSYTNVSTGTGVDLTNASTAVNETVENVTEQQAEIRAAEFVRTDLSVRAETTAISFADPLAVQGRLTTAEGAAIADQSITLRIHNQTLSAATDSDGRFTVAYRPVTLPLDADAVTVRYVPDSTSTRFGSTANQSVAVSQTNSTVSIETASETAAFGDRIGATARVTAAADPVSNVPVALSVDGRRLATARTAADGTVTLSGRLPATVRAGDRELRVSVATRDRAVATAAGTAPLTVTETATILTASGRSQNGTAAVQGTLSTAAGAPVSAATVEIRRDGSTVTTAQTGPNGSYATTISGEPGKRYRLTAVYDEPSTNLGRSTAETTVGSAAGNQGPLGDQAQSLLSETWVAIGGAGLALLVGLALWYYGRRLDGLADESDTGSPAVDGTGVATDDEPTDILADARAALGTDATAAVERAYRGVRGRLQRRGIGTEAATHWEFYRACRAAGLDDAAALEELTMAYEHAAFDPGGISGAEAQSALEQASRLA